ncbi:MAG: hypothetical protein KBG15_05185 [Kofleriaceae bacterium]|nr:hypothetical protein [Kofleriaceae bacterium]
MSARFYHAVVEFFFHHARRIPPQPAKLEVHYEHDRSRAGPIVSYFIRYFADRPITTKHINQGLQALDPSFKIDLGELLRGDAALGQLEVNQAKGDMFEDDLRQTVGMVQQTGRGQQIVPRLMASQAIVVVAVEWNERGQDVTMDMLAPLWSVLAQLSPGLSQWDGNGIFDGGTQLVDLSAAR